MTRDDDRKLDGEEPITPGEQARAEAFGRLVDGLLQGEALPPAMDSDARALVETATVVMASSRAIEVPPERTRRLVDQALEAAILRRAGEAHRVTPGSGRSELAPSGSGGEAHRVTPGSGRSELAPAGSGGGGETVRERQAAVAPAAGGEVAGGEEADPNERSVTDVRVRRRRADRVARVLPWAVASLAAAAAIVLFIARPPRKDDVARPEVLQLEASHISRPADPLFGRIAPQDRYKASERIDVLYADRMAGYRDLMFRRALPGEDDAALPEAP